MSRSPWSWSRISEAAAHAAGALVVGAPVYTAASVGLTLLIAVVRGLEPLEMLAILALVTSLTVGIGYLQGFLWALLRPWWGEGPRARAAAVALAALLGGLLVTEGLGGRVGLAPASALRSAALPVVVVVTPLIAGVVALWEAWWSGGGLREARVGPEAPVGEAAPVLLSRQGSRVVRVALEGVEALVAEDKVVLAWGPGETVIVEGSLLQLEKELGPTWVRVHRGALVKWAAVASVGAGRTPELTLRSGRTLQVSRRRAPEVRRRLTEASAAFR